MTLYQSASQWSHTSLILSLPGGTSWISLLALSEPDTVLDTTSLASISFTGPVPIFPSGHRPPLFTLVDYEKRWASEDTIQTEPQEPVVVTTPTMPRMKLILEEKVLIDKWMAKVQLQPPPNHIPWGHLEATPLEANYPLTCLDWPLESPTDRIEKVPRIATSSTRWLRRKDPTPDQGTSCMRHQSREATPKTLCSDIRETQRSRHFPFHSIAQKKHSNLAIRRGHKAFPCLKLQHATTKTDSTVFDTIPTAFRGSPLTSSLVFDQTPYPLPQNISLAEMLGNLRTKCASLVTLSPDWLHRSRSCRDEITKLSDTVFASHSCDDEWAFAEPLMDMINSFSGRGDDFNTHPILMKDGILDKPIDSRGPYDVSSTRTVVLVNNDAEDTLSSPDFQVGSSILHPPLIIPSSLRKPSHRSKIKKTVRFADSVTLTQNSIRPVPEKPEEKKNIPSTASPPRHRRSQSISLSALIPPSPTLSVVRSLQLSAPPASSWTRNFRNDSSGPSPRPLSHRFPRSPKLPLTMDENLIPRSLNIPPPKTRTHKRASVGSGESLFTSPISRPSPTTSYLRFKLTGRKARIPRENLRISGPLPMGTAIPPAKKKDMGVRRSHGKDNVTAPLRSIFMKLK